MQEFVVRGTRLDPLISIDDPRFVYVNAATTDIRKTFDRERARLAAEHALAATPRVSAANELNQAA